MRCLLEALPVFDHLKFEISNLKLRSEGTLRQWRGWADSLQNSDIRGQRYLTDKGKRSTKAAREREAFLDEFRKVREGSHSPTEDDSHLLTIRKEEE